MKRKIYITLISLFLIILGGGLTYLAFNSRIQASIPLSRQGKIETSYFRLVLPSGWETQEPAPEKFILKATYVKNNSKDLLAQKINYKTNLYIAQEELDGKTMSNYIKLLNEKVQKMKNDSTIHSENETAFNGNKAYLIDIELKENGIEFKSIVGVIQGKNDDVWVISFNTPKLDWITTASQFYGVLNSFTLK